MSETEISKALRLLVGHKPNGLGGLFRKHGINARDSQITERPDAPFAMKTAQMPRHMCYVPCGSCAGKGWLTGGMCPECMGDGEKEVTQTQPAHDELTRLRHELAEADALIARLLWQSGGVVPEIPLWPPGSDWTTAFLNHDRRTGNHHEPEIG